MGAYVGVSNKVDATWTPPNNSNTNTHTHKHTDRQTHTHQQHTQTHTHTHTHTPPDKTASAMTCRAFNKVEKSRL